MAGGTGSRLSPVTTAVNKHLLPVFDKPLIYYPLSTLMLAGIREILLISSPREISNFELLLGSGEQFGITIDYAVQRKPNGIAEGITLGRDFIKGHKVGFILGDNLFHGAGLGRQLAMYQDINGAQVFAYPVRDPENYGVVEIHTDGTILNLTEKPKIFRSNLAVTGLYFYDEQVSDLVEQVIPSARGELEITDLNELYLKLGRLNVTVLSRGTAWLDTGTFSGLHDAASYIKIVQERQNSLIGDPYDVAISQGWK